MCINFKTKDSGKQIVNHLITMKPLIYDFHISEKVSHLIPEINDLVAKNRRTKQNSNIKLAQRIQTKGGQELFMFSKSSSFGDDLYSGWIDTELKTSMYVETWRNGAGNPLNSSCPKTSYHVNNIQDLKVEDGSGGKTWSYVHDHSKWAISDDIKEAFVCISDINRMESQFKRGGGAVCIQCKNCWSVFSNTILDIEPCKLNRTRSNQS